MTSLEIEKRIHPIFKDMARLKETGIQNWHVIGKYQYIVKSKKGHISIVELPNYFGDGMTLWEIYCMIGDLFDDVERFSSYDEALEQCKKYLEKT